MSRRKDLYSNPEEIRRLCEELEEDSEGLDDLPSSDEDGPVEGIDLEDERDPDYSIQEEDEASSSDTESEVEEFDAADNDARMEEVIADIEISSGAGVPSTSSGRGAKTRGKKRKTEKTGKTERTGKNAKNANEGDFGHDGEEHILSFDGDTIRGRERNDGSVFMWKTRPIPSSSDKTPKRNVVHVNPGPAGPAAREALEPIDCFSLFITPEILEVIMKHTNSQIRRSRSKDGGSFTDIESIEELKALLGLFIYSAARKDNHLPTTILFDSGQCGVWYRSAMSVKRFEFLVSCLRFDDKETRDKAQKFAPIAEIWEVFLQNCRKHYKPGSYVTIDEQLVGFRGRCPFRMYLPNKPAKYGLKIIAMVDSSTKYLLDAIPYIGKGSTPPNVSVASHFIHTLVSTIKNTNRNVTFDNWFTSIPLASELLRNGLTCIGTVKKNKTELPPQFIDLKFKGRKVGSSLFIYHEDVTAVSYKSKVNKMVTLISTMHGEPEVHPFSKKPLMIHAYNSTKGGVDTFDQICSDNSCNRKTKRWPLCFFYNMINAACVNSYVVYKHNFFRKQNSTTGVPGSSNQDTTRKRKSTDGDPTGRAAKRSKDDVSQKPLTRMEFVSQKPLTRMEFMFRLNEQMSYQWKTLRLKKLNLNKILKSNIEESLKMSVAPPNTTNTTLTYQHVSAPTPLTTDAEPNRAESSIPPGQSDPSPASPGSSSDHSQPGRQFAAPALQDTSHPKTAVKRRYCDFCPSSLKRKTATNCEKCKRFMCGTHILKKLCADC